MPNLIAIKFSDPHSLVAENTSWLVLLRPRQLALGSQLLVFSALSAALRQLWQRESP